MCYIVVVIVGRYFYLRTQKAKDEQNKGDGASTSSTEMSVISDRIDKNGYKEAFGNNINFEKTKNMTTKRQRSKSLQEQLQGEVVLTRK